MSKKRNLVSTIIILTLLFNTAVFAPKAEAFNLFRRLRRVTRFVLNVPYKATKWMGPKLGPIAGTILSQNLMGHHKLGKIFSKASKIDKTLGRIEDVQKQLTLVKKVYGEQAKDLRDKAQKLKDAREVLSQKLVEKKGYTYADFKKDALGLDELIKVHEQAADMLENRSKNMGPKDVIKLFGKDLFKTALKDMEGIVFKELDREMEKFINPEVILDFLSGGSGGFDAVLDFLVKREMDDALGKNPDITDEQKADLMDRIKKSLKDKLKQDAEYLKKNWDQRLKDLMNEGIKESGDGIKLLEKLSPKEEEKKKEEEKTGSASAGENYACAPGYKWDPQSGRGCIQANCNDISDAHWSYEGYCVCGSSGSAFEDPEDPNKECAYGPDNESCPGCVYACVDLDAECPDKP